MDKSTKVIKKVGDLHITDKCLGKGSFATVYLGYLKTEDDIVAVKVIDKKKLDEFRRKVLERELQHLLEIKHENIVNLKDMRQSDSLFYLSMEFCNEGTLNNYLEKLKIGTELIMKLARDIIEGFRFLYSKSIIHRDIKPDNILVDDEGNFKLGDFGFSKTLHEKDNLGDNTFVGTPIYACPEIINHQPYSSKCDVYSVALVLFEVAYSHHPFFPKNIPSSLSLLRKTIDENPEIQFPASPELSENFKNMLRGMLQVEESNRLSWPQVFEMFDQENSINYKKPKNSIFLENFETASFFPYAAKAILEVIKVSNEKLKVQLYRIRFFAYYLFSTTLRDLKNKFQESSFMEEAQDFCSKIEGEIELADSYYSEECNNCYLIELNEFLNIKDDLPDIEQKEYYVSLLKKKIQTVLQIWKKEKVGDSPGINKMLLCLHFLEKYPSIPTDAKAFIDANHSKTKEVLSIVFS